MTALWDFFENLDEIVYVSDMDTYEIIYMNRRARDMHRISSNEDMKGRMCYEVLQGCLTPCAMCHNDKLRPGEFYEWTYYNPILGKTFAVKDTMLEKDGRRYHMKLTIDITIQERQKQAIREFTANETLINEGLRLALSAQTPDKSLEVLLQYLGQSLKSDRVYIFEETPDHTFNNTYEWCANGVTPQKDNLQNVPYATVQIWYQSFMKNQNILIKDLEHIRSSDPLAYDYLVPQSIHSLVVSPLIFNKEIIGFYGIDNPPQEFLNHISVMFQVMGHFIVSILKRRDLVKRLEALSYYDQLTGAKNRHGMNDFIASVNHEESIGILYCDVMGLKKVNDTLGHLAGDALLIRAYQCLLRQFPGDFIFRIGGDEFLVMHSGISEEYLNRQVQLLKEDMPRHSLSMALGWVWRPRCAGQITELLKEADQRMYDDKRAYYQAFPNERRSSNRPRSSSDT